SETSAPPTPTFSLRGHSRFPSSNSSLASSSTSPICDHSDVSGSSSKLPMPKLDEDPTEHDDFITTSNEFQDMRPFDLGIKAEGLQDRTTIVLSEGHFYDLESSFGDGAEIGPPRALRTRKSSDSPISNISNRFGERFPSFSGRWNKRKPAQLYTGSALPSLTSSRPASSRSSSLTSANFPGFDQSEPLPATPSLSIGGDFSAPASPIDIHYQDHEEPFNRQDLASTPLLPPMMDCPWSNDNNIQSPLQSPSIADPAKTLSIVSSQAETPLLRGLPSPSLSSRPSVASFHRNRTGTGTPSTLPASCDVPFLFLADPNDEWSIKLGHANYSIQPEPYVPEVCDASSCRQLVADWELARTNYFRHKHRTIEHYGSNSKTFKLTEQKWAHIEAVWKKNNDLANIEAARNSTEAYPIIIPNEPAPLTTMPTLDDPRNEGKFPKLGDQDIVGPMEQIAARAQPPARQSNVVKFLSHIFGRQIGR
ncbi:hypothetical protein EJ08DRAFT_551924, partial [Tothia fuscella]